MDAAKFLSLINLLKEFNNEGSKQFDGGTLLIARAPHIAPYAWLHSVYPPLNMQELNGLENQIGLEIPASYKSFLLLSNGLRLFHTFSLDGLRTNYKRTVEDATQQPFDITTPNTLERPRKAGSNIFYIGGYSCGNGAWLYIDSYTGKVHMCKRWKVRSLYEWPSFDYMLESEINRLLTLFTREGKNKYPGKNILPPFSGKL